MQLQVGQWIVNDHENQIKNNNTGAIIKLEPRAMAVLAYIAHNADRVISRDELIEKIWDGRIVSDHAIYRVITQIRKALGSDNSDEYIKTISKKGYKLTQPVTVVKLENVAPEAQIEEKLNSDLEFDKPYASIKSFPVFALFKYIALGVGLFFLWNSFLAGKWDYYSTPIYSNIGPATSSQAFQDQPEFSRDGKYLIFLEKETIDSPFQIFLKENKSGKVKQITDGEANWVKATISNDAKVIIAVNQKDDFCEVVRFNSDEDGYSQQELFSCKANPYIDIEVSNDGGQLYYTHKDELNTVSRVFSYSLTTGKRKQLTEYLEDAAYGDHKISLSNDNKFLAFLRNNNFEKTYIGHLDLLTEEVKILTEVDHWIGDISWTNDSSALIYQADDKNVFKYSVKYGYVKPVISGGEKIERVIHSTFNETMAIVEQDTQYGFWKIDSAFDSGKEPLRTDDNIARILQSNTVDYFPTYANTSNRIAFMSTRSGTQQIWLLMENGELKQLTYFKKPRVIQHLVWSPDDSFIATYTFDKEKIFIVDTNNGAVKVLVEESNFKNAEIPMWSKDGRNLFFASDQSGEYDLYQVSIDSLETKRASKQGIGWRHDVSATSYLYVKAYSQGLFVASDGNKDRVIMDDIDINDYQLIKLIDDMVYFFDIDKQVIRTHNLVTKETRNIKLPLVPKSVPQFSVSHDQNSFVFSDIFRQESKISLFEPLKR